MFRLFISFTSFVYRPTDTKITLRSTKSPAVLTTLLLLLENTSYSITKNCKSTQNVIIVTYLKKGINGLYYEFVKFKFVYFTQFYFNLKSTKLSNINL